MKIPLAAKGHGVPSQGLRLAAAACVLLLVSDCLAASEDFQRASQLEESGQFRAASNVLAQVLKAGSVTSSDRNRALFEQERLTRIRKDFPFTQEELFKKLRPAVAGLDRGEFERWVAEGRFDSREIDGALYFMGSSIGNLFHRYPELDPRRRPPEDDTAVQKRMLEVCREIKRTALASGKPYVLPIRFNIGMTVTAEPGAAPTGQTVRAWLPLPREYPYQSAFELVASSSPPKYVGDGQSPIRSILLEQPAAADQPTRFHIEYNYTRYGVFFDLEPAAVKSNAAGNPALKPYLNEAPHIVFTPEMRELSRKLGGDERNPYLKAKKFYDWIAENIKYSHAIEYSTIRNISEYCRAKGYGDCGQEALLFMTLCRLNGIPARWQSGWNTFPGDKNMHDWCEIYFEPYGWIPVDPDRGMYAMRYATSLSPEERREVRDFYFGGMDEYRLAANSDHCQDLAPAKRSFRSDTVDFQRGELEWGEHNIYFDQFSYALDVKTLPQNQTRSAE